MCALSRVAQRDGRLYVSDGRLYVLRRGDSDVHVHVVGVTDARSRCDKH